MNTNNEFKWDPISAVRKATSNVTISAGGTIGTPKINGHVTITKTTEPNNPKQDAYRNCKSCGKHYNYHANGKCPKN